MGGRVFIRKIKKMDCEDCEAPFYFLSPPTKKLSQPASQPSLSQVPKSSQKSRPSQPTNQPPPSSHRNSQHHDDGTCIFYFLLFFLFYFFLAPFLSEG